MRRAFTLAFAVVAVLACGLALRAQGTEAPFFFIQITDPQFGMSAGNADVEQEIANLDFAVATANRLRPAFVIVTGDLVNRAGDEGQIGAYLRSMSRLDPGIPAYHVAGNHDVENVPTPETLVAYVKRFGPDHYSFRHGSLAGIVLNSVLIAAPEKAPEAAREQEEWLRAELERAKRDGVRHLVVFQHHPFFLEDPAEPDRYENIPGERRTSHLALLAESGVTHVFAGHYHRNALGRAGGIDMVTTGPIGMPLGGAKSGMRIVTVTDDGIEHRYYELGELPNRVTVLEQAGAGLADR